MKSLQTAESHILNFVMIKDKLEWKSYKKGNNFTLKFTFLCAKYQTLLKLPIIIGLWVASSKGN